MDRPRRRNSSSEAPSTQSDVEEVPKDVAYLLTFDELDTAEAVHETATVDRPHQLALDVAELVEPVDGRRLDLHVEGKAATRRGQRAHDDERESVAEAFGAVGLGGPGTRLEALAAAVRGRRAPASIAAAWLDAAIRLELVREAFVAS